MTEPLLFSVEEHIALLTLNRPDIRNASWNVFTVSH